MLRDVALAAGDTVLAADYDPKTDACPPCTSPLCRDLGIQIQDAREDWRQECVALLPLLPGSRGSEELETRRLYRLLDWSIREAMPTLLEVLAASLAPHDTELADQLRGHVIALRALAAITNGTSRAAASKCAFDRALDLARAFARAFDLNRAFARAFALDLNRAFARAFALDLNRALDRALDRDRARALDRARARVLARVLAFALDRVLAFDRARPSPVALLQELLEMEEADSTTDRRSAVHPDP
ncbi:MAG: hypothetical protein HY369_00440 [Candidatus Aenigmarchaeota archaeon]|nr:hypothetical protein [Candidatus Aenigmarchaeota archaeon]